MNPTATPHASAAIPPQRAWIDGEWLQTTSTVPIINPATEQDIGVLPTCDASDVDRAVGAARRAHTRGDWAGMSATRRSTMLRRIGELIREHRDELATLDALDSGRPFNDLRGGDVDEAADCFDACADMAEAVQCHTYEPPLPRHTVQAVPEPVGVVAAIAPWNFPLVTAAWKIAPPLATGNAVIFKPSEHTSLSALRLAALIEQAGLPHGQLQVVTGAGTTGAALAVHPGIDKLSFTGSTATGRAVLHASADHVRPVTLELGGKSPNIIFDDADTNAALEGALNTIFVNAGQVCTAGSRLLLHDSIHDDFLEKLVARASAIRVGDPFDPRTQMGPMTYDAHHRRVLDYVEGAKHEGARLRCGGGRPPGLDRGYFIQPTVFDRVDPSMRIDREEVFGPVLVVHRFESDDDAISLANATPYGLAASVWTTDPQRAQRTAARIDAGTIWINTCNLATSRIPFGGFKQSGFGLELGPEGLREFLRTKHVWTDHSGQPCVVFKTNS